MFLYGYSNRSQDEAEQIYEAAQEVLDRGSGHPAPPDELGAPCFASCGYFQESDGQFDGFNEQVGAWFTRGQWVAWQFG